MATLEGSLTVSYKSKHNITRGSSNGTSRYLLNWFENLWPHESCFMATMIELNSCDRDHMAYETLNIYYLNHYRKKLTNSLLDLK